MFLSPLRTLPGIDEAKTKNLRVVKVWLFPQELVIGSIAKTITTAGHVGSMEQDRVVVGGQGGIGMVSLLPQGTFSACPMTTLRPVHGCLGPWASTT